MQCHICEQNTESFIDKKTDTLYYHCRACEYIFKSPECYQDFTAQKERYNLHTNDESDAGYIAYFQRFLDFLFSHVDAETLSAKKALDFGCGASSILSDMLQKRGIPCDYYDPIYHPQLDQEKSYGLIVSTEVFEHLHHPRLVFEGLVGRLEEGGYLAIQTQFHDNDVDLFKRWYYHQDSTHIVFFRVKTFTLLAKQYGCRVVGDNHKNMILIKKL